MTPLTHALVRQIASEEAAIARASFDSVIGMGISGAAKLARRRAFERITRETGCSAGDLARVWGCDRSLVSRYVKIDLPPSPAGEPPICDAETAARLRWAHGEDRAAAIIAGRDAATAADIASWRRLCWRAAA